MSDLANDTVKDLLLDIRDKLSTIIDIHEELPRRIFLVHEVDGTSFTGRARLLGFVYASDHDGAVAQAGEPYNTWNRHVVTRVQPFERPVREEELQEPEAPPPGPCPSCATVEACKAVGRCIANNHDLPIK